MIIFGINFPVGAVCSFTFGSSGTVQTSYGPSEHAVAVLEKHRSSMDV